MRVGGDGVVWHGKREVVVAALAVVGVGPWLSGGLCGRVGAVVVDLGQARG